MKSIPLRLSLCLFVFGLTALGCGAGQNLGAEDGASAASTAADFEKEPEVRFSNFSVPTEAATQTSSPYLVTFDGSPVDKVCFQPVRPKRVWKTQNPEIIKKLTDSSEEIEKVIIAWFGETMVSEDLRAELDIETSYENVVVDHAPLEKLRLSQKQECIDGATGGFLPGTRIITTQFGARKFSFKSDSPIQADDLRSMRKAAGKAGCRLSAKLFDYPKALGLDGKRRKDEKGRRLFEGPKGEFLKKADIPPPGKRPSLEWSLSCDKPLYFAVGEIVNDGWAKEISPEKCSVNLIYQDATPRVPECGEFKDAGFGIEEIRGEEALTVKVTTDGVIVKEKVPFGERQAIQVAGRVVVWVEPERIVAGALLHVDSFVLEPNTASAEDLSSWPSKRRGKGRK